MGQLRVPAGDGADGLGIQHDDFAVGERHHSGRLFACAGAVCHAEDIAVRDVDMAAERIAGEYPGPSLPEDVAIGAGAVSAEDGLTPAESNPASRGRELVDVRLVEVGQKRRTPNPLDQAPLRLMFLLLLWL